MNEEVREQRKEMSVNDFRTLLLLQGVWNQTEMTEYLLSTWHSAECFGNAERERTQSFPQATCRR